MSLFNKRPFLAAIIVLVVLFGVFMLRVNQENFSDDYQNLDIGGVDSSESTENISQNSSSVEENQNNNLGISLEELSKHNNKDDCWVVYKGKVYDVTSYIPRHPGGEDRIAANCGHTDLFEERFTKQHGTSKVSLLMNVGTFIGDFDIMGELNN